MSACRRLGVDARIALWLLLIALPAGAQTEAILQGVVSDPSGAIVIGSTVLVERIDSGTRRQTLTDTEGRYRLVALAAGEYRVEVRASAFRSQILERFLVEGGRTIVQDFRLAIGEIAEDVVVSTRTSPLDRATVSVGHVLDERTLHDMPLNGRRFLDLAILLPGSVTPPQGGFLSAPSRGDGFYG